MATSSLSQPKSGQNWSTWPKISAYKHKKNHLKSQLYHDPESLCDFILDETTKIGTYYTVDELGIKMREEKKSVPTTKLKYCVTILLHLRNRSSWSGMAGRGLAELGWTGSSRSLVNCWTIVNGYRYNALLEKTLIKISLKNIFFCV